MIEPHGLRGGRFGCGGSSPWAAAGVSRIIGGVRFAQTATAFSLVLACGGDDGGAGSGVGTGSATGEDGGATNGGGETGPGGSGTEGGSGSDGAGSDGAGSDGGGFGACGNEPGQLLRPEMPWNTRIDDAAVAAGSADVIGYLQGAVNTDARFQIDFSITVLEADADTPRYAFSQTDDFYAPDCDPAPVPVPDGGHIEGEADYACEGGGDCHLIVVDRSACRLYEQWRADFRGPDDYAGGCLALWSLDGTYDETLRGDYCTSADAAGLPIAALLFDADEVAAGEIRHAIRFIVPNANIRDDIYVRPGTHSTPATSGPLAAPPYAGRLRLRSDVDLSGLNPAAQVVARAMQHYGIILADAGSITFTAASDDFTDAKWDQVGLGPHDLKALQWSDFEVVDTGPGIVWSDGSCERTPTQD